MNLPTFSVVGIYCFLEIPESFDPRQHSVQDLLGMLEDKGLNHEWYPDELSLSYRYSRSSDRPDFAAGTIIDRNRTLNAKVGSRHEAGCLKWDLEITTISDIGEASYGQVVRSTMDALETPIRALHTDLSYRQAIDQNKYRVVLRAIHRPFGYQSVSAEEMGSDRPNKNSCVLIDGFGRECIALPQSPGQFPSDSSIAVLLDETRGFKTINFHSFDWAPLGNHIGSITIDGKTIHSVKHLNGSSYSVIWQYFRYCIFPQFHPESVRLYTPGSHGVKARVDAFYPIPDRSPSETPAGDNSSFMVFFRPIALNLDPATIELFFQDQA